MGSCKTTIRKLRHYVDSRLKGPSEIKISKWEQVELGVFLGYLVVVTGSNKASFYNFFYNESLNKVLRFKYKHGFDYKKYFFNKLTVKVLAGTLSIYPTVGTIIPRTGGGHRVKLKLRPIPFSGRIPLYISHGLLKPLLCSAVVPVSSLTTAALQTQSGKITRAPFALVALRPDNMTLQGSSVVIKAGATKVVAEVSYALGSATSNNCVVLAIDLTQCNLQRTVYVISFHQCDVFTQAPVCTLWGFKRVKPQHLRSEIERLLSAGAEPNSLIPVVDKGCVERVNGSARKRLLECANYTEGEVILPTEEYVELCGIERKTIVAINSQVTLKDCTIT